MKKKHNKTPTPQELEEKAEKGEDLSPYFDPPKIRSPMNVVPASKTTKITLEVSSTFLHQIDSICSLLNVKRHDLLKIWIGESLERWSKKKDWI